MRKYVVMYYIRVLYSKLLGRNEESDEKPD